MAANGQEIGAQHVADRIPGALAAAARKGDEDPDDFIGGSMVLCMFPAQPLDRRPGADSRQATKGGGEEDFLLQPVCRRDGRLELGGNLPAEPAVGTGRESATASSLSQICSVAR